MASNLPPHPLPANPAPPQTEAWTTLGYSARELIRLGYTLEQLEEWLKSMAKLPAPAPPKPSLKPSPNFGQRPTFSMGDNRATHFGFAQAQ